LYRLLSRRVDSDESQQEKIMKIQSRAAGMVASATSVWVLFSCSMATSIQRDALDYNTYRGIRYTIRTNDERDRGALQDHSLQALSLLNELVSAAKVSSDIPNTEEIQFVP
jgi:hypothetical protein